MDETKLCLLDVEWSTGTVWAGESVVASSSKPVPPGTDMRGVMINEDADQKPWIDYRKGCKELKCNEGDLKKALESTKR